MASQMGINEALVLACLAADAPSTVAEVAARLEVDDLGRRIDDGSIYMALQRMAKRNYVVLGKTSVVSADGRPRIVGAYRITQEGERALQAFMRQTSTLARLKTSNQGL